MSLTVYGIPTCGTVKKARSWLEQHGIAYEYADLRLAPPSAARVAGWIRVVGVDRLKNLSGGSYRALGPERERWSEAEWCAAFARDPMLIRRPVIERDGELVLVGFKEDATELARLGG